MKDISSEFVQESLNTGFPTLLLSITAPQKINLAITGFDMENLHRLYIFLLLKINTAQINHRFILYRYVNWINVVGYNFHSAYETKVNHHSPLYNIGSEDDNLNLVK